VVLIYLLFSCTGNSPLPIDEFVCPVSTEQTEVYSTWTAGGIPVGGDVFWMEVHPQRSDRIVAASSLNGLYISVDSGITWQKQELFTPHIIGEVSFNPDDPTQFVTSIEGGYFAGIFDQNEAVETVQANHPQQEIFHGVLWRELEILATDEKGDLWSRVDWQSEWQFRGQITEVVEPPPHGGEGTSGPVYFDYRHIYLTEGSDSLFAVQHDTALFRSDDQGVTWQKILEGPLHVTALNIQGDQIWMGGSQVLFSSADNGETWEEHNVGNIEVQSVLVIEEELIVVGQYSVYRVGEDSIDSLGPMPDVHYLISGIVIDQGILISDRNGFYLNDLTLQEWSTTQEGLIADDLSSVKVHPSCPNILWTGTACENGLYRSDDFADSLSHIDEYFHYVMGMHIRPQNPYELWVVSDYSLKKSYNLGVTWETVESDKLQVHMHGFDFHPSDENVILIGTVGSSTGAEFHATSGTVLRSDDGGESWQESNEGIPENNASMHALHFMNQNPSVVILGTYNGGSEEHEDENSSIGLYRSVDEGLSWMNVSTEFQSTSAIVECNAIVYAATENGVYRSVDEGVSWEGLDNSGPFLSIGCWKEKIVGIQSDTIVLSIDGGLHWEDWSTGLPDLEISSPVEITISKDGALAYIAVPHYGLFRRSILD
jgi:photosystem II stability/assembly factor-like uncharacterized protein